MEYIHGLNFQARLFFQSIGFGFLLGILYDTFRTLRIIISSKKAFVIFMDTAYFVLCGFLFFCFSLVLDNGEIRAYLLFGNLIGWMIYYFSLGFASAKIRALIRKLKRNLVLSKPKSRKIRRIRLKNTKKPAKN